jgi:hypothetical protein
MNSLWKPILENTKILVPDWVDTLSEASSFLCDPPDWASFPRIDPQSIKYHAIVHAEYARYEWNTLKTQSALVNANNRLYLAFNDFSVFPGYLGYSWLEMACYHGGWKAADAAAHCWRRFNKRSWKDVLKRYSDFPLALQWLSIHDWRPQMNEGDELLADAKKQGFSQDMLFRMWIVKITDGGNRKDINARTMVYDTLAKYYPQQKDFWHIGWTMQECPISMFDAFQYRLQMRELPE